MKFGKDNKRISSFKARRQQLGLSHEDVAVRSHCSGQTVRNHEQLEEDELAMRKKHHRLMQYLNYAFTLKVIHRDDKTIRKFMQLFDLI